jgi:hypothetical protein
LLLYWSDILFFSCGVKEAKVKAEEFEQW